MRQNLRQTWFIRAAFPAAAQAYRLRKDECASVGFSEKVSVSKFPGDEVMRQKWIKAIPRKNWTLADSH